MMAIPLAVLIVEDSENDAQLIVHLLQKAGYEVISEQVETAEQMSSALEERTWNIVISDYNLPQFNGRAALELLKEKQQDIPFIVVSGMLGEESAVAMMKAGAHDYLMKNNLARLVPAVERELEQAQGRRERRQAELALRENEERWRRAIADSPIPIMIHNEDDRVLQLSAGWTKFSGYTIEDIPTLGDWTERAYGERTGSKKEYIDQLFFIDQTVYNGEWTITTKDGSKRIWEFQTTPLGKDHGGRRVLHSMAIDVTERKQAENQLRQLSSAVEHSPSAIMITDMDGKIEYVNPKFTALTGYELHEVRGKTPRILKSDRTPAKVYTELWQDILSGKEWRGEFLNRKKNGELYWEHVLISTITDSDGNITHFVAVNEDVTVRKEAEEKIRRLNDGLEQLAMTDYLTNLYNRRYFMQRGTEEFKRSRRNNHPLSLLMIDIDEFKKVNDTYGHESGDMVLQQVAATLKSSMRETDILGRMGGEEFAVLLPDTLLREAALLARRILQVVANTPFEVPNVSLTITISIGVAVITDEMSGVDDLLRNADAALYTAKHNGRNRVMKYKKLSDEVSGPSSDLDDE
jgi:diguanylate cyclase (GGDEF)-like protein/PAS domain S-box-containing protein